MKQCRTLWTVVVCLAAGGCGTRNSLQTGSLSDGAAPDSRPGDGGGLTTFDGPPNLAPDGPSVREGDGSSVPPDSRVTPGDAPVPSDVGPTPVVSLTATPRLFQTYIGGMSIGRLFATFVDGTRREVSGEATWTVADPTIATIGAAPFSGFLIKGLKVGNTTITASLGGQSLPISVTVREPILYEVRVDPERPALDVGRSLQLKATALFSGSMEDATDRSQWITSAPSIASITAGGLVTCKAVGVVGVSATFMNVTGMTGLSCTGVRQLSGLILQPVTSTIAVGGSGYLTGLAVYSDGTAEDVTTEVAWSSSAPAVAMLAMDNEIRGVAPGTVTITANYMGHQATARVSVITDPPLSLELQPSQAILSPGSSIELTLFAVFRDGRTEQFDADRWASSDPSVASVDTRGFVETKLDGKVTITATLMNLTATATLTVTTPKLTGLRITPANPQLRAGEQLNLVALALYSDASANEVTDQVIWSSSDPKVAVVERSTGLVIAVGAGTATVKGAYQSVEASATVTVRVATPKSLFVAPAMVVLEAGELFPLQAVLVFDDGSSEDVTSSGSWRSNNPLAADVDGVGIVTANSPGTATIILTHVGLQATAMVTVSNATLQTLTITPATVSVPVGQSSALVLMGMFSDGTSRNLTARATWVSSSPGVALVGSGSGSPGLVSGVASGTATVTASYLGRRAMATVTVP